MTIKVSRLSLENIRIQDRVVGEMQKRQIVGKGKKTKPGKKLVSRLLMPDKVKPTEKKRREQQDIPGTEVNYY